MLWDIESQSLKKTQEKTHFAKGWLAATKT